MAIEDAASISLAVRRSGLDPGALRAHLRERRTARVRKVHDMSWRIGQLAHWRNPAACFLRDVGMRLTPDAVTKRQMRAVWGPGVALAEALSAA